MQLADPATVQQFETTVVNADFLILENAIIADRLRLTAIEQGAARSTAANYTTADLTTLAAIAAPQNGDTAMVTEGGALFARVGGVWVQQTPAFFATDALRDAAYAKAAGAFKVVTALVYRTDTGYLQRFNGTIWRYERTSLVPVVPVLVGAVPAVAGTNVTLGASGQVNFNVSATININNVFTAEFDAYRIIIEVDSTTTAASITLKLRLAGVDTTGSTYAYALQDNTFASGTVASVANAADTSFTVGRSNGATGGVVEVLLVNPFLTKNKTMLANGSEGSRARAGGGYLTNANSYDGFTVAFSAGTAIGNIRIYGVNNN